MSPFNIEEFHLKHMTSYPDKDIVDIHKDNPTILYHE